MLGIDPGVSRCGYGAVAAEGSRLSALAYGVIRTPPGDPLPDRLAALRRAGGRWWPSLRPAAVAVERVFFQTNVRTAMSVGQASGLALAVAARAGMPVCQYTPNEVKQAVAGYGAAGKAQVQAMVTRLLNLSEVPKPPDAADALALAICHLSAGRFRGRRPASQVRTAAGRGPAGPAIPPPPRARPRPRRPSAGRRTGRVGGADQRQGER